MKKIRRRTAYLLSVMMLLFALCGNVVTSRAEGGSISASSDGSYIYITYTGPWNSYFQETVGVTVDGAAAPGEKNQIVVRGENTGDSQPVTVRNAWSGEIAGATATLTNEGKIEEVYQPVRYTTTTLTVAVPVSYYGDSVSSVGLSYGGQYVEVTTGAAEPATEEPTTEAPTTEEPTGEEPTTEAPTTEAPTGEEPTTEAPTTEAPTGEEPTTEAPAADPTTEAPGGEVDPGSLPDLDVNSSLAIDGHYDEWSQYPVTDITYQNNNAICVHSGQLYVDGDRVYVHYSLHDLYQSTVKMHEMTMMANGQPVKIGLYPVSGGQIDWNRYNQENVSRAAGNYTNYRISVGYYDLLDSDGYITVYDSEHAAELQSDEVEFSFSLSDFKRAAGISGEITNLTLYNPNIGREGITWVGTPTGPVVGLVFLLAFAMIGYWAYTETRKRKHS